MGDVEISCPLIFRRVSSGNSDAISQTDTSLYTIPKPPRCADLNENEEEESDEEPRQINYNTVKMSNTDFRAKIVTSFHRRWDRTGEMES